MSSGQHFRARTSHRIPPVIEHGLLEDASFIDVFPGYIYMYMYMYIYMYIYMYKNLQLSVGIFQSATFENAGNVTP